MGNSLPSNNGVQSYRAQLGESATIQFRRGEKFHGNGKSTRSWLISYAVGNLNCKHSLINTTKYNSHSRHDDKLEIEIIDDVYGMEPEDHRFFVTVERDEASLTRIKFNEHVHINTSCSIILHRFVTTDTNAMGGITETIVYVYGRRTRRGLTVVEKKKKSKDENPYMATVAHYYANDENGEGVGLSVVVKRIRVSDNGFLDFDVEGPEQHPLSALLYMFDEAARTSTWKPTHCPHCANLATRREDGDIDNAPKPLIRGLLDNDRSRFRGPNSGNVNITKLIVRNKGR